MTAQELKMLLFSAIIECFKIEMKMSRMAKLHEMESAYKAQMNDFLKLNFKLTPCDMLYKLYEKHVLSCRILIELI